MPFCVMPLSVVPFYVMPLWGCFFACYLFQSLRDACRAGMSFFSVALALFLVELRRPAAYFPFFCVFLLLYISNLWPWQLIYTETISAFRFRLYWLFSLSVLYKPRGGYAISLQNNLELHLGCHTCWLSYITLVCLCCERTVGRMFRWLPKFLEWVDNFLTDDAPLRSLCTRESFAISTIESFALALAKSTY